MTAGGADADPRAELRELAAALRAHLEYRGSSGATGVPRGDTAPAGAVPLAGARRTPRPSAAPHARAERGTRSPTPEPGRSRSALRTEGAARRPRSSPKSARAGSTVLAETVQGLHAVRPRRRPHANRVRARHGELAAHVRRRGTGRGRRRAGLSVRRQGGAAARSHDCGDGLRARRRVRRNIVKCRPPNNRKPEPEEMAACLPYLAEQIELVAPEVIVALGATAVQGLFGTGEGITRIRGRWRLYKGRIPVMPTFHPAYLLRTPAAKREVWDDLRRCCARWDASFRAGVERLTSVNQCNHCSHGSAHHQKTRTARQRAAETAGRAQRPVHGGGSASHPQGRGEEHPDRAASGARFGRASLGSAVLTSNFRFVRQSATRRS